VTRLLARARPYAPAIAVAALAAFIAWAFCATTLVRAQTMGLPLDDSYIYLTYAKQFGRAQPFTYYPGGGYSAGATSILWPMVLGPLWTLGARGHALVWASYLMCSALFVALAFGLQRIARHVVGDAGGMFAAAIAVAIAPFAFGALSGMEVALAAALLIGSLLLLAQAPVRAPPRRLLIACLAATALARPEAMLIVFTVCAGKLAGALWRRQWRVAVRWLVPVLPALAWLCANRVLAGHFMPNTGVAKSYFHLPGFDWTFWRHAVFAHAKKLLKEFFATGPSPLVWTRAMKWLLVIGAVRTALWAHHERRYLVGALIIAAPVLLVAAVIASSGNWSFQNYRYIAPAMPLFALLVGIALAPPRAFREDDSLLARIFVVAWIIAGAVIVALFARAAYPTLRGDMQRFAQGAVDTNRQVVTVGQYLHRKLPGARVMIHDAGAIAYYGDTEVYDMLGLVTNDQAEVATNGPGARFEFLEHLPPERRPDYFAYYPGWMGTQEFFGEIKLHTMIDRGFIPPELRLVGEGDMQVIKATWDHVGTGERPLGDHTGWDVVDRVDVADLDSERAHAWHGDLGRRSVDDPTARWSVVEREVGEQGLVVDGGRTIRGGERFTIELDPTRPARIVVRTGGQRAYPYNEVIDRPVQLSLFVGTKRLGTLAVPAPSGKFEELAFNLPRNALRARTVELRTEASAPYRAFQWFALQPTTP